MTSAECPLTPEELEELDELMIGAARPAVQTHGAGCASCRDRITSLSESIEAYNVASLAWAQARSNTFTRDLSTHTPTRHITAPMARSMATMLLLGAVAGLTAWTHLWNSARPVLDAATPPAIRAFAPETRAQQIARDNAMLEAIDAELTEPESAPPALVHAASSTAPHPASAQDRD